MLIPSLSRRPRFVPLQSQPFDFKHSQWTPVLTNQRVTLLTVCFATPIRLLALGHQCKGVYCLLSLSQTHTLLEDRISSSVSSGFRIFSLLPPLNLFEKAEQLLPCLLCQNNINHKVSPIQGT